MSASAIADAYVTMLGAASVFGSGNVTKGDYGVLNRASGSCCVVEWSFLDGGPATVGGGDPEHEWTHELALFVRDSGDTARTAERTLTAIDAVVGCLMADQSLQGEAAGNLQGIRADRAPREAIEVGGHRWLPIFVEVTSLEW